MNTKLQKNKKNYIKKYLILILTLFLITGCGTELTNQEKLEKNEYQKIENSTSTRYENSNFSFIFFKDSDDILIAFENENITSTFNPKNSEIIEMYECKLDINTNEASVTCSEDNIEELKKAYNFIQDEIKALDLNF